MSNKSVTGIIFFNHLMQIKKSFAFIANEKFHVISLNQWLKKNIVLERLCYVIGANL